MKPQLFLIVLCLLLFTAIGQAQPISLERPPQAYPPYEAPQSGYSLPAYVPAEGEVFIFDNGSVVRVSQTSNVVVGLQAPGEFMVGTPPQISPPYGAPQGGYYDYEPAPMVPPPTQEELPQMQMEALGEQWEAASQRAMAKGMVRSIWNGQGVNLMTFAGISEDPTIATAWGISEEQLEQIGERMDSTFEQMGDPMEAAERNIAVEMGIPLDENGSPPDGWEPDMETMMKMQANMSDIMESSMETMGAMVNTAVGEAFNEILTPQQLQTIQESQLANIEALPFFSPSAFEALDLSDAQREQMEQIRQELEPEFETVLDSWVDGYIAMEKKLDEEYSKEQEVNGSVIPRVNEDGTLEYKVVFRDPITKQIVEPEKEEWKVVDSDEHFAEVLASLRSSPISRDEIRKKLLAEDPEYKRLSEAMQSKSKAFAENFKTQMFDVLTDEQWARLQELINNPPEHALAFRKALRETLGIGEESEKSKAGAASYASEKPGVWIPGPGAWQPGSGVVPEGYRQERSSRFPRGEERSQETEKE